MIKYGVFIREKDDTKRGSFTFKMVLGDDYITEALSFRFNLLDNMGKDVCLVDVKEQKIIRKNYS